MSRPGWPHKMLWGEASRRADPNWSKWYSIPDGAMLDNKTMWSWLAGCWSAAWGLSGHQPVGDEQLHMHHLFCIFFCHHYYFFPSFLFCSNELSLSQPRSFTFFVILYPIPLGVVSKRLCGVACCFKPQESFSCLMCVRVEIKTELTRAC